MIDLYNSQITDLLPPILSADIYVRCISFAIRKEMQRILTEADHTRTLTVIDELPEKILDVLAVELRSPYYLESMDVEMKRNIVKKTLFWHSSSGTPAAVEELVEIIFGEGRIVEWFDFTEGPYVPGTFDIITNARMTEDIVDLFLQIIRRVKNARSHIRRILVERGIKMDERIGTGSISHPEIAILNHYDKGTKMIQNTYFPAGVISSPENIIINSVLDRDRIAKRPDAAAAAVYSRSFIKIDNCIEDAKKTANSGVCCLAAARSNPHIAIINGNQMSGCEISHSIYKSSAVISQPDILI